MEKMQKLNLRIQKLNLRMQKLNLRMQKLDFPGTHWRGLALIGTQKKPWIAFVVSVSSAKIPESVNYHFTRQCNYSCGFCFHTAKTSYVLPEDEVKTHCFIKLSEFG